LGPSPEHSVDDQTSLRAPSLTTSPHPSPSPSPRRHRAPSSSSLTPGPGPGEAAGGCEGSSQQALGSTETLKRGSVGSSNSVGGGRDEPLLSSCESAKTICESREAVVAAAGAGAEGSGGGGGASPRTPSISVEEDREEAEVDSLAEGSVGGAESEDRFDWASEEAPRRPDSLKGIQSFQRSHSNLASLGLAFPAAPNGSLGVGGRWPSAADRGSMPEDWESYTYSPGYERMHSKSESPDRYLLHPSGLSHLIANTCFSVVCSGACPPLITDSRWG